MRAVNLVPAEQRQTGFDLAGRSGGFAPAIVVLLIGLAVLAFMYGSAKHGESKSKAELVTVNAELSSAKAQAGRLAPYTSFIAMANQRVQEISGLVEARFDWSHAFHELGRVLPHDTSLTSLQGQVGGSGSGAPSPAPPSASGAATATSATPPGSTPMFTVSGCTTSQSEVALTLQRLRLIDGVTDVELQSSTKAAKSGGGSTASSGGGCASGGATFAATITFTGLPSAPPTNPPSGSRGQGVAAGGSSGSGAPSSPAPRQVSNQGSGR
jgi:Tfp pilus assembly protein PilN